VSAYFLSDCLVPDFSGTDAFSVILRSIPLDAILRNRSTVQKIPVFYFLVIALLYISLRICISFPCCRCCANSYLSFHPCAGCTTVTGSSSVQIYHVHVMPQSLTRGLLTTCLRFQLATAAGSTAWTPYVYCSSIPYNWL